MGLHLLPIQARASWILFDSDGDTISDIEERIITTDEIVSDVNVDFDSDGLSNFREYQLGTDLYSQDSDEDGLSDYKEVEELLTNPLVEDSDGDGYSDGDESIKGTDPLSENSFPGLQVKPITVIFIQSTVVEFTH